MKAIILVAGYATRLYPLTKTMPKALLEVGGKTIIDYIVTEINTINDISEIFVVSNEKFYNHFKNWGDNVRSDKKITVINDGTTSEDDRKGAIGDMQFTIEQGSIDEDIIVIAGDNLFTYALKGVYDYFKKSNKDIICGKVINDVEMLKSFAVAVLDENNKVIELVEKPEVPPSNIGVFATYLYKKETLPLIKKYLDEGNNPDAPGYFVQWLYKVKDVLTYKFEGECYDIGTHKALEEVRAIYNK